MDNNPSELMPKKKSNSSLIIIIILLILVLALGGYIVYDKLSTNNNTSTNTSTNNAGNKEKDITYNSYKVGDKVTVQLNDSTATPFYVLKQSSETEEFVTLFAEKNIGTGAFNNDYTDGNEYNGSLIESKVNELTASWTNVKEKRLITVDEIEATGLTEIKNESRCVDASCPVDHTYVKENTFLLYSSNIETPNLYEMYWTMTKASDTDSATGYTNRYVYLVDMSGSIDMHIVGYKPGSQENKDGNFFANYGIRPVIVVSKEYIK